MASTRTKVSLDTRKLDKLSKYAAKNTEQIVWDEVNEIVDDMNASWSPSSPSVPGQPPAVVSGNLRDSISARQTTKGDKPAVMIEVKAHYASFLEFGTARMSRRPFIRPAMFRAEQRYPNKFKRITEE